jgi:hypothetical protein
MLERERQRGSSVAANNASHLIERGFDPIEGGGRAFHTSNNAGANTGSDNLRR